MASITSVADSIVADAGALAVAVTVGSPRLDQAIAIGELIVKFHLRRLVGRVEDLNAVESVGD